MISRKCERKIVESKMPTCCMYWSLNVLCSVSVSLRCYSSGPLQGNFGNDLQPSVRMILLHNCRKQS